MRYLFCLILLVVVLSTGAAVGADNAGGDPVPGLIAFTGVWDRAMPLLERAAHDRGMTAIFPSEAQLIAGEGLGQVRVLYLLNLRPSNVPGIRVRLMKLAARRPDFVAIALDHRDVLTPLIKARLVRKDARVPLYWRANGLVNMRRLLGYTVVTYLGQDAEVEPPVVIPNAGYYLPGVEGAITDLAAYRARAPWREGAPLAALLIQQSFWVTGDTMVIDAEFAALNKVGFNVVTLFGDREGDIHDRIFILKPDILIEDRHGSMWSDRQPSLLEQLHVPYLRPISMLSYTINQWRADPRGLHPVDVGLFLTIQESKGTIEPVVVGGLKANTHGFKLHEPIPGRVEHFARRAWAWSQLHRKANAGKKIAIVYYNKNVGKDDLMRGSPTGAFLDAPASLLRFLPRLKQAGYAINPLPADETQLLKWIKARGRNIGPWAQGELETLADRPDTVLIPLSRYQEWFTQKLNEAQRTAVVKRFGPPPGKLMVVQRNGQPCIVLPGLRLGNVLLAPQPARGEKQDETLLHSRDVPPPHNYLAFYWWLQEDFLADAVVHWGTHGTVEMMPGKEAGLAAEDWGDVCVGTMPVINLWIMDNLAEATLSRRRSYALLVDHMVPPAVNSGLTDELKALQGNIGKMETLETGILRESFRKRISATVLQTGVGETLGLKGLDERLLTADEIDRVAAYLHHVYNTTTPVSLHVLGQPPPDKYLMPYLVTALHRAFLDRLSKITPVPPSEDRYAWLRAQAEELLRRTVLGDEVPPLALTADIAWARELLAHLRQADLEIANLLRALNGEFIPPGPGPDPVRNPASVPAGRSLYALNPEEIPTRPSWDVAIQLVRPMLAQKVPHKVGIDLNGMNTMRDFGVNEAQILYLLGVRPVWNESGLAIDVQLIPRAELGRPRIDVFVAMGGLYKENFPTRVKLLDKAVRLAASADEPDNGVRLNTDDTRRRLLAQGFSDNRAAMFAEARIFGTKPGNMSGTNILYLVPRSGVWEQDDEIASVYIDTMSYVYTGDVWGQKIDGLYEQAIQGTDTLVRVWASNMTSQLSNHHAYEYLGGLSLAVTKLTGRQPAALIADVRDPNGAEMRDFSEVLATTYRCELLNRKWIAGMMQHDYSGAGQMTELVKNSFGWAVTRRGSVSDQVWRDIVEIYVHDKYKLGLCDWFERTNPHAMQEIAATLLEAARKGYWQADEQILAELARMYADSVARHGDSGGLVSGGNQHLAQVVSERLQASGDAELAQSFQTKLAAAAGVAEPSGNRVRGQKLEAVKPQSPATTPALIRWPWPLLGVALALLLLGFWYRSGGIRS